MGQLVFLSYSHKDVTRVRRFRDLLRALGFAVWPDQRLTPGTTTWTSQVDQRLSDSAVILLFLSKYTTESKWVDHVLNYARLPHRCCRC